MIHDQANKVHCSKYSLSFHSFSVAAILSSFPDSALLLTQDGLGKLWEIIDPCLEQATSDDNNLKSTAESNPGTSSS